MKLFKFFNNFNKLSITFIGLIALNISAEAQENYFMELDKTIKRLGAQGDRFYVDFNEPFGRDCGHGVAYIKGDRKGLYAQLLAAKISGKRLSRVDYSQASGNGTECLLELVEIVD